MDQHECLSEDNISRQEAPCNLPDTLLNVAEASLNEDAQYTTYARDDVVEWR